MKRLLTLLILSALTCMAFQGSAQPGSRVTLKGRVLSETGTPVEFATILVASASDSTEMYGDVADEKGNFSVQLPQGDYKLKTSFVGYENLQRNVKLNSHTNLGTLTMTPSTTMLDEVVVTGSIVSREADRFVVNVATSPLAAGRSSNEMLALSPGVSINDKGEISIYGRSGTQVMIDDRLLKMSGDELLAYLENIRAEDILKIEVIPYAGAEYEASATGGVIKITMKKQREEGLEGSVSMRYRTSVVNDRSWSAQPAINLNYKYNALSIYSKGSFQRNKWNGKMDQQDRFHGRDRTMDALGEQHSLFSGSQGQLGAVYDINDRQSAGFEFNVTGNVRNGGFDGTSTATENGIRTLSRSRNTSKFDYMLYNLIGYYKLKFDTLGSTFKALAAYTYRNRYDMAEFYSEQTSGDWRYDSLYRNYPNSTYQMYTLQADFDIVLSKTSKLNTGLRYARNDMNNTDPYDYYKGQQWHPLERRSSINQYTENITAVYVSFSTKFKNNIALQAGLRGEYTYTVPSSSSTQVIAKQNYFGLFPNANLSIPLNKKQSHMLILGYGRKIRRPNFWQLIPMRQQISEYSFSEGNPKLKPAYLNDYSLSWVIQRKYTLTAGIQRTTGAIEHVVRTDTEDPNILIGRPENIGMATNCYITASIPIQITKWWMLNANLNGRYLQNQIDDKKTDNYNFMGNCSMSFTFCKNYSFNVDGFYMSPLLQANYKVRPPYQVNVGLKGSFLEKRITATVSLYNVTNAGTSVLTLDQTNVTSVIYQVGNWRTLNLSLSYNFHAGKKIKIKTVEGGKEALD